MKKIFTILLVVGLTVSGFCQNPGATQGLPPGMTLSGSGVLSGTPTALGTYTFTVQACDTEVPPQCDTHQYTIIVFDKVSITTPSVPNAVINRQYTPVQLNATGGNGVYNWSTQ